MNESTSRSLHQAYAQQGGVRAIFSSKVDDYVASRPDYPAALFDALGQQIQPGQHGSGADVVDLGAGTGLLTHGLLAQGYRVVAVEPNPAMRAAADHWLGHNPHYQSVAGSAESIPLPDGSADLITAAQAFHWFEIDKARTEALRVLRPQGQVALVWNDRVLSDPLHGALDEVFAEFGGAQRGALLAHEERHQVPAFFGAAAAQQHSWPHAHRLTETGLTSLVFSRSYMPPPDTAAGQQAAAKVHAIFAHLSEGGTVSVRYTTVAIIGRPT